MINNSNWHVTRKKGVIQFIIVNGILLLGIPVTVASVVMRFYFGSPGTDSWGEYLMSSGTWIGLILQALLTGIIFGAVVWFLNERKYGPTPNSDNKNEKV
ncbi:MAG: hypothetical protein PSX80_13645 [bacterium]|nr:hypothetical protein [bacterium]